MANTPRTINEKDAVRVRQQFQGLTSTSLGPMSMPTFAGLYLKYDLSNYATFAISSTGDLTVTATGGDISFGNENLLTTGTFGAGAITGTNITDSGLTITRVPYVSTGGLLIDSSVFTFTTATGLLTTTALTATGTITGNKFTSNVAPGISPYACTSTTVNSNLNADLWDGYQFADYLNQAVKTTSSPTFATPTVTGITIGANTLTTAEWAYLDGQNQSVLTTSNVTFGNATFDLTGNTTRRFYVNGSTTTADVTGLSVFTDILFASKITGTTTSTPNYINSEGHSGQYDADYSGIGANVRCAGQYNTFYYTGDYTATSNPKNPAGIIVKGTAFDGKIYLGTITANGGNAQAYCYGADFYALNGANWVQTSGTVLGYFYGGNFGIAGSGGACTLSGTGSFYYYGGQFDGRASRIIGGTQLNYSVGGRFIAGFESSGTVLNATGCEIAAISQAATGTNIGIDIGAVSAASVANYSIYSRGGDSIHVGKMKIGDNVAPTVACDVTGAGLFSTTLSVTGIITASDKIILTQTDGNEYIDSLNDGYVDVGATTGIRLNATSTYINGFLATYIGANVASNATITPTGTIFHVTGITTINTINVPYSGFTGQITIIPDGLFSTGITGNIALATVAVVSKELIMTWDNVTNLWYPSY